MPRDNHPEVLTLRDKAGRLCGIVLRWKPEVARRLGLDEPVAADGYVHTGYPLEEPEPIQPHRGKKLVAALN